MNNLYLSIVFFFVTIGVIVFLFYRIKKSITYYLKQVDIKIGALEYRFANRFDDFQFKQQVKSDWVVVISYNRLPLLKQTVKSLKQYEPNAKILIIDNGSDSVTQNYLQNLVDNSTINKLLMNQHKDVPQWQKSFSIVQALKILSIENIASITWIDDDILVTGPWISISKKIFDTFKQYNIKLINCLSDDFQNKNHITKFIFELDEYSIDLKTTFNGAFFFTTVDFFSEYGIPPLAEGVNESSVEDWYYSRQIQASDGLIATIKCGEHIGYNSSKREEIDQH